MASTSSETMEMEEPVRLIPRPNISEIKNKKRRQEMYKRLKQDKRKFKLEEKKRKQREAKDAGVELPKQVPKTIESLRVPDETMVNPEDEEVLADEAQDELAPFFNRETNPKILLTTSDRPGARTNKFCKQLKQLIPNTQLLYRRGLDLKKIIPQAIARDFTDVIVVHEDRKIPNGIVVSHLPEGPTANFKLTSVKLSSEIKGAGEKTDHKPEVILNNFNTRLGHSVGRMMASLFPLDAQFNGRSTVTFHNQRDFIFCRHHRYIFRNAKKVGLQELGPRFTMKLRSLQKGTFDSKFGEYEYVHKRHEMETSRRKFFL